MQHGAQPFGPLRAGRQAEVEPGAGDGLLSLPERRYLALQAARLTHDGTA